MNHFERALSDSDQAIKDLTTDIEYMLKITAKLQRLGKLSINSVHMIPYKNAVQEDDLMRGVRATPEVLGVADSKELDIETALNNRTSPFGEEKILYGSSEDDGQQSLFDIDGPDDGSNDHIIYRGDE